MPRALVYFLCAAVCAGMYTAAPACAAQKPKPADKPLWEIGLGVGGVVYPDFRGSTNYRAIAIPFPTVIYRGKWLRASGQDAHALLFNSRRLHITVSGSGAPPVDSGRDNRRQGMPDRNATFSVGPSFDFTLSDPGNSDSRLRLRVPVRPAFKASFRNFESLGVLIQPYLQYDRSWHHNDKTWSVTASAGPLFATDKYHDYYYTVAPRFATKQRPAFDASGGYSGFRLGTGIYRRAGRLRWGGYLSFDDLHGTAFGNSPLVATHQAIVFAAFVSWQLWQSKERAPVFTTHDSPYD